MSTTSHHIPILLTSSIVAHDIGVVIKDANQRLQLALESVAQWLRVDPTLALVLCDGSSFDFAPLVAERFPHAHIECLHFENDQAKVRTYGRGYGEGEIIRYALTRSQLIARAGCFAKCTSKLWVENFAKYRARWTSGFLCKGIFTNAFNPFRPMELAYIDTRFYIADLDFYRRHLADAHFRINERPGFGLEDAFCRIVLEQDLKPVFSRIAPIIYGVGGGTGVVYQNRLVRRIKEDLRLQIACRSAAYRAFFGEAQLT